MTSTVAWLDSSADEQRRVRDILALFSQQESRDELGIGQIRDALSDLLFPGTSVLQTRARYFLIVPWAFNHAARRGPHQDLSGRTNVVERQVVEALSKGDDDGVIGRRAGAAVKNLPSTVFWSGLRRFGILTHDVAPTQLTGTLHRAAAVDGSDELAARQVREWHATLPAAPEGFPHRLDSLRMTKPEAEWLRERVMESCRGSLLEFLMEKGVATESTAAPWEDRIVRTATEPAARVLQQAQIFSLMIHGASLLYNLLVGQRYVEEGCTRVEDPVATYRTAYAEWLNKLSSHRAELHDWDAQRFFTLIDDGKNRVSPRTCMFVNNWTAAVTDGSVANAMTDQGERLKKIIAERERSMKKGQSRLTNTKLLGAWQGAAGAAEMVFRWDQVRRLVADVHEGLASA